MLNKNPKSVLLGPRYRYQQLNKYGTLTYMANIKILNLWVEKEKYNRKLREKNPATGTIQYRDDSDTGTGNGRNRNF